MPVSGQLLSGMLRGGGAHTGWKTPYTIQCTWSATDVDTVVIHGLTGQGQLNAALFAEAMLYLATLGFKTAKWVRVSKNGKEREITVNLEYYTLA